MRYLLYSYKPAPITASGALLSGLFQWHCALGGQIGCPELNTLAENYDVVHVNGTSGGLGLIGDIAEAIRGSDTKLLVNVDYAVEMWDKTVAYPSLWLRELDKADVLFHVEPRGADLLSIALQRPVHFLPHPVDTNMLIARAVRAEDRRSCMHTIVHRYEMSTMEAWMIGREFKRRVRAKLDKNVELGVTICTTNPPEDLVNIRIPGMFDWMRTHQPYELWVDGLAKSWAVYDSNSWSTYGRVVSECAALCVPCVGNKGTFATQHLFPKLAFEPGDVRGKLNALTRLAVDRAFYKEVVQYALETVQQLAYAPSKKAMLELCGIEAEENDTDGKILEAVSGRS